MTRRILGYLLFLVAFSGTLSSCIDEEFEELGDAGKTFVKTMEKSAMFFSPFEDVKKVDAFSIRRDAHSSSSLQQSATVKIVPDAELLPEGFELLPEEYYTVDEKSGFTKSGNGYTATFNSGDFAREFTIHLDGSKWTDLSKKYALAFRIEDAGGLPVAAGKETVVAQLAIKNKYDGMYEMTGTMSDVVAPNLTGAYPLNVELHTMSENSVALFDTDVWGDYFHTIMNGDSYSGYGGFAPIFTMDEEGNVISVTNYYGQPAPNGRAAMLDPSGVNKFTVDEEEGTKTLEVSYIMVQAGAPRTFFTETFTFKGDR
ncbi:BT_3987 domain-containing protein [Pontibacter litorisediminis]|uniref:BT_3987 domain-containing protein n=1 Tax=Pontibacter litorisediminis TaxID=1846260 RepID=UPI0023EA96EA|nr:DUF1735 domain-containing protein [Pontibacter litorisediminis]